MKLFSRIYLLFCLLAAAWLLWQLPQGGRIQTDLAALLPADEGADAVWRAADAANEKLLNGQILLLVGAPEAERAFPAAEQTAARWRDSGLFDAVDERIVPDLAAMQQDVLNLGVAVLPPEQVRLLHEAPHRYFEERAQAAANPFAAGLLPPERDWLGFGRFAAEQRQADVWQWQPENGMLYAERDGLTWVLLRAKLPEAQGGAGMAELLPLLAETQAAAGQGGYRVLAAGGALFAAHAKAQAERESSLMSAAGIGLTLALLLWVFRSARPLLLFVPLGAGILLGLTAAVAVFGQVHVLTLVIGTSLVGVLVDFPLHWLTPALFRRAWQADAAMRHVLPAFLVSLGITVSGYVLLWFTPLPVLRQTAVFSAAALLGSFAATVLWLPPLFRSYACRRVPFARSMAYLAARLGRGLPEQENGLRETDGRLPEHNPSPRGQSRLPSAGRSSGFSGRLRLAAAAVLGAVWLAGMMQTVWHDDIRNWAAMPPDLLEQARQAGDISGGLGSGQFVLFSSDTPDGLLLKSREITADLQRLGLAGGDGSGIRSLSQWLLPAAEQRALKAQLRRLAGQPDTYAAMRQLGIPDETVQAALLEAADRPDIALEQGLAPAQAEVWRHLYLGRVGTQYAALIRLSRNDADTAARLHRRFAEPDCNAHGCARLADKRARLNSQFQATRNQAAWLKLASFALAWLVLWRLFGLRRGSLMLAVPLAAAAGSVGLLGWLGVPVSLFAMFGLLLTAAIGVDYVVYALTAREPPAARIGGITLAALTTAVSFVLLAFSSTPAVAAFGITVAAGCVFNWLFAVRLAARRV